MVDLNLPLLHGVVRPTKWEFSHIHGNEILEDSFIFPEKKTLSS